MPSRPNAVLLDPVVQCREAGPRFDLTPGSENSSEAYAFQRQEALARLEAGETQADVARSYGVDATTIGRLQ
jgi:hypothetical protein